MPPEPSSSRTSPAAWPDARGLYFPYMGWAHTSANRTDHPLTQSGMPQADATFLEGLERALDLDHPARYLPALEEAIARRHGVPRQRVVVAVGATGGMYQCAARWFRKGARVVADVPSYEPFRSLPKFFGAELLTIDRRPEDGWSIDPAAVRKLFAGGSGPGHVFVANPHNPTGVLLDARTMSAIAAEAARAGGLLVSCDIYMEYVPRERAAWAFACAPNAVTIGSLTKAYGLGALRMGWIVLGEGLVGEKERIVDGEYLGYVDPPTASIRSATLAFDRLDDLIRPVRVVEKESRPTWAKWLTSTEGIECVVPEHGIIAFPRVVGVEDTVALSDFLATKHGVDVVPGEYFGKPGHVRVGCGLKPEKLREALSRLERGIRAFRGSVRT
jgi:aspartate/methionine/tyrosine aminotransferase